MPHGHVQDQVADIRGAVAADIQALQNAIAQLWYLSARCRSRFFDEVAELVARVVVLVVHVRYDAALGSLVSVWVGRLPALLSLAALVLAYHSGCANG